MAEKQPLNDGVAPQQGVSPPPYAQGAPPTAQPYPGQYQGDPQMAPPPGGYTSQPAPYPGQPGAPGTYPGQPGAPGTYPGQPGAPGTYPGQPAPPPGYDKATGQPQAGYVQQPGMPVMAPPGATVVVQQQRFSQFPANCVCPNCHQNVVTTTVAETSTLTWLIAGAIILFGGWICCLCLIPFCIDDLKDVRHLCPSCKHTIHVFRRM